MRVSSLARRVTPSRGSEACKTSCKVDMGKGSRIGVGVGVGEGEGEGDGEGKGEGDGEGEGGHMQ
jgi:hypothetical protein